MLALASINSAIGGYLSALIVVYIIILLAYLLTNMIFSFGARPGYAIWSEAILNFLRDCSLPYLQIFRRFIPSFGPLDLSPMIAIFVLFIGDEVVRRLFNA